MNQEMVQVSYIFTSPGDFCRSHLVRNLVNFLLVGGGGGGLLILVRGNAGGGGAGGYSSCV